MLGFLTLNPDAFGLDFSDSSLKIAQLEKRSRGFRLSSFGEARIPEGVIQNGEIQKEDELARLLKKAFSAVKGKKLKTKYVVAALPEEKAFVQVVQFPRMREKELGNAIHLQAENYIPYPIDTVYLDFSIIPPFHNHVDHLDVLLASLPRKVVDAYVSVLQKAELTPKVLEIEAAALSRAVVEKEATPVPLLLVDVGTRRTKVSIFSGYSVRFTTSLSFSSEQFTHALAEALHVDVEKAEELKQTYGLQETNDPIGKEVFSVMKPVANDFVEQIKKYIEYYETHVPHQHLVRSQKTIKKIILCGGGANLKGFCEFLMRTMKIEAEVGNPWVNILPADARELPALSFQDSLRYSTALGLALRGARRDE